MLKSDRDRHNIFFSVKGKIVEECAVEELVTT